MRTSIDYDKNITIGKVLYVALEELKRCERWTDVICRAVPTTTHHYQIETKSHPIYGDVLAAILDGALKFFGAKHGGANTYAYGQGVEQIYFTIQKPIDLPIPSQFIEEFNIYIDDFIRYVNDNFIISEKIDLPKKVVACKEKLGANFKLYELDNTKYRFTCLFELFEFIAQDLKIENDLIFSFHNFSSDTFFIAGTQESIDILFMNFASILQPEKHDSSFSLYQSCLQWFSDASKKCAIKKNSADIQALPKHLQEHVIRSASL